MCQCTGVFMKSARDWFHHVQHCMLAARTSDPSFILSEKDFRERARGRERVFSSLVAIMKDGGRERVFSSLVVIMKDGGRERVFSSLVVIMKSLIRIPN